MDTKIKQIKISGFKSIAELTLENVTPYSVFAGPNGSGKSNLADALGFVGSVIELGSIKAMRKFNGFNQIHCYKLRGKKTRTFEFNIDTTIYGGNIGFFLKIQNMDDDPVLEEDLIIEDIHLLKRKKNEKAELHYRDRPPSKLPDFSPEMSSLMMLSGLPVYQYLSNIRVFRFDPLGAKEPDASSTDMSELNSHGHNVATMLATLEKKDGFREQIIEWMELLVPGMEKVSTERQRLDGSTVIKFKEAGTKTNFPANLISDGTIYALCVMTAVLSRSKHPGITIIEEPERGIHPKAIGELVQLMRENATTDHPVFVTTHSESVVRASRPEELWLVNKEDGRTVVKNAAQQIGDLGDLTLDKAWLMNFFDGGLPW